MTKNQVVYKAYVQNQSGAGEMAGSSTNLNGLKQFVRAHYGKGWKVTIEKVESDEGSGWFEPVKVCSFVLRG